MRGLFLALYYVVAAASAEAATFLTEDFSTEPFARGWQRFGEASLFGWDSNQQHLVVTWDSSRTNSYCYRPLGTILARDDDFQLAFDLRLNSIAIGTTPGKPYTFQIAIGLINWAAATQPQFFRGSGMDPVHGPRSVLEFSYFPDSGFGATISPSIISRENEFASAFSYPLELDTGALFRVVLQYRASNQTLTTTMTRNGAPFGPIDSVILPAEFADVRLDTLAVCSYSDAGQVPPQFAGSVLAQGTVDNFQLTLPGPPAAQPAGALVNGQWQQQFGSRTNWLYVLDRSVDLHTWIAVSPSLPGTGGMMGLNDTNTPAQRAFYRVRAERP